MKFIMMSDTHYISRSMVPDGDSETLLNIAVTEQALYQAAEETDTIIISGDLTDRGDRPSHEELVKILRDIKSKGKNVYVIFATHDFNHHHAFVRKHGDTAAKFRSEPWMNPYFDPEGVSFRELVKPEFSHLSEEECTPALVESCTPEEIWELYREFGREQAISADDGSFSYCVDLDENTRCLMLNDIFRNEEGLKDKSPSFTPSCFRWMKKMIDEARWEGKYIFAVTHHPLAPTVPLHRVGTDNRNLRSPLTGHLLADLGLDLVFCGHAHASVVNCLTSDKGSRLWQILTPSVRFYPPVYRRVELDGAAHTVSYEITDIKTPSGLKIAESDLREHYYRQFYQQYYREYSSIKPPLDKLVKNGRVKDIYFLIRKNAGLTASEYAAVKDRKLYDMIVNAVFNMLTGDGAYTPETVEYRLMMSIAALADSVIDAQPFMDIRGKSLQGYTVAQLFETVLFKNGISDNKAVLDLTSAPKETVKTPEFSSHAGDILMTALCVIAVPLSLLLPPAAAIGLPVKTVLKKLNLKKHPPVIKDRY